MCTKAARDEVYDLFNQTLEGNDTTEVTEHGLSSDDDYTSAGESTGTGHMSATTSEFEEDPGEGRIGIGGIPAERMQERRFFETS